MKLRRQQMMEPVNLLECIHDWYASWGERADVTPFQVYSKSAGSGGGRLIPGALSDGGEEAR